MSKDTELFSNLQDDLNELAARRAGLVVELWQDGKWRYGYDWRSMLGRIMYSERPRVFVRGTYATAAEAWKAAFEVSKISAEGEFPPDACERTARAAGYQVEPLKGAAGFHYVRPAGAIWDGKSKDDGATLEYATAVFAWEAACLDNDLDWLPEEERDPLWATMESISPSKKKCKTETKSFA